MLDSCWVLLCFSLIFIWRLFLLLLERQNGGEEGRETSIGCLLYIPRLRIQPQSRHVPWPGIESTTFCYRTKLQQTKPHWLGQVSFFKTFPWKFTPWGLCELPVSLQGPQNIVWGLWLQNGCLSSKHTSLHHNVHERKEVQTFSLIHVF